MVARDIKRLEEYFNTMECPDCGGLHQCRLYTDDSSSISVIFDGGGLIKPCYGYIQTVHKELKKQSNSDTK